jgi:hypothetical protein
MSRIIESGLRTGAIQITSCVSSLFALELLHSGGRLYLCTSQLRNAPILVNDVGQFDALFPEIDTPALSLSQALSILAERGARVHVIYAASDPACDTFLAALAPSVQCRAASPLRNHGLFAEDFCLHGSLSFTDSGVDIAGDRAELSTEPGAVSRSMLEVVRYWEELA